jgi:tRNA (guanosine-2'-O-)-methyltransferase
MDHHLIQFLSEFVTKERLISFNQVLSSRTDYITVVLEDIFQTQNTSAVVRSSECFGIMNVHVIENKNVFHLNPDVVRGASNWVNLIRHNHSENNTPEAFASLRQQGYRIVAATPHNHDINLEDLDLTKGKIAVVFGCERPGLSEYALNNADEFMKIPMVGFTESLNVSVSAAISLHYLTSKLRNLNSINWHLSEETKQEILLSWLRATIKRVDLLENKYFEELR